MRRDGQSDGGVAVWAATEEALAHLCAEVARAGVTARPLPAGRTDPEAVALALSGRDALLLVDATAGHVGLSALRNGAWDRDLPLVGVVSDDDVRASLAALEHGADDVLRLGDLARELPVRLVVQRRIFAGRAELRLGERDLRTLVELTRSFASALDPGSLLSEVTRRLASELRLSRCSIVLVDERGEVGTIVAASDEPETAGRKRIELGKYPEILEALRTRRPVVVEDAERHPLLDPVKEAISAAGLGALAVLPMVLEEQVLGVLFLRSPVASGGSFSARELGFAGTIANATAVALRNARSVASFQSRTAAAEARSEQLRRFEDIHEHLSEGLALVSAADGSMLSLNPAAHEILGLPPGSSRGLRAREVITPLDEQVFRHIVDRVRSGESVKSADLRVRRHDGRELALSVSASRLRTSDSLLLAFRDDTARHAAKAELERTRDFLQKLIDSSVDAIVAADMRGRIILFNKGAEDLLGHAAADVIERMHVSRLYPEGGAREVMGLLRSESLGGAGRLTAHRREVLAKTGERVPVQMTAALIREGSQEIATVGIFADLRERLATEEKLVFAQERLEKTERAALIAELAGTAAHELNQPLTSVLGYAELLKRKVGPEDPRLRAVETILREAERMAEIVRKIGKITRYETKPYVGDARIVDLDRASGTQEDE